MGTLLKKNVQVISSELNNEAGMVVKQLGGSSLGCDISSSRLHSLGSLPKLGRCNGPKVDGLAPVSILCITARARGKGRDQRARLPQAGMPTAGSHRQASQSVAETKAESDRWQQGGTSMETEIVTYVKDLIYSRQLPANSLCHATTLYSQAHGRH